MEILIFEILKIIITSTYKPSRLFPFFSDVITLKIKNILKFDCASKCLNAGTVSIRNDSSHQKSYQYQTGNKLLYIIHNKVQHMKLAPTHIEEKSDVTS